MRSDFRWQLFNVEKTTHKKKPPCTLNQPQDQLLYTVVSDSVYTD